MGAPFLSIRRKPTSANKSDVVSAANDDGGAGEETSNIFRRMSQKVNNAPNNNTTNGNSNNNVTQTRSMRLSIAPDDESESMQVNLVEGSPIKSIKKSIGGGSPIREYDCIYTVGSVEYLVKHATPTTATGGDNSTKKINDTLIDEDVGGNEKDNLEKCKNDDDTMTNTTASSDSIIREGTGNVKMTKNGFGSSQKKSSSKGKMGFSFKKSSKKDDNSDESEGGGGSSNNNYGGGDPNGDKNDDNSKDDQNGDDNKDSAKRNGPEGPTSFTPKRIQFALDSTLPLHSASESTAPPDRPSWTPVDGTEFKVRHGPNYPKNGAKESSLESLYEVYCVRFFRSQKRTVGGATRIMPLPEMDMEGGGGVVLEEGGNEANAEDEVKTGETDGGEDDTSGVPSNISGGGGKHHPELTGTKLPDVLVVHFMLPYEPPNMFKQRDDGPGGECIYYLKPSKRFLDEISGRTPITPAATLFAKWCEECESSRMMRSRFKCMALVRDIDRHNFGLLKNYNGKPVLITESGRVCSGYQGDVRYLEMTANVHYWAFMAKKGFVSIIPKFANMQMEVGFTIEAHTDSEMPECMLGSTVLSYISDDTGPMISAEMQEPVHEHQS